MKPFVSDKGIKKKQMSSIDDEKLITSDYEVAETSNRNFDNAVRKLDINETTEYIIHTGNNLKICKYPSIVNINKIVKHSSVLFEDIQMDEIEFVLKGLIASEGNTFKNIPAKLLKENKDIGSEPLFNIMNNGLKDPVFDNELKSTDVTPVHKCGDTTDKKCYTPISVLPVVSKVFEKIIHKQIVYYMDTFLSQFLCGFNAPRALLALLENWRTALDKKRFCWCNIDGLIKVISHLKP